MVAQIPEVLTTQEQERLLAQLNPRYPTGHRNKVLLRLMLNTGLRVSEATALRWSALDMMSGRLMVWEGKGAQDRSLWIRDDLIDMLGQWRTRQGEVMGGRQEYMFTTLKGTRLDRKYLWAMVKRQAEKAGIEKNISPHTLRHTFATDLYRETKDIRLVQKALGHASLANTMIYTHIVDDELEDALKSFRL